MLIGICFNKRKLASPAFLVFSDWGVPLVDVSKVATSVVHCLRSIRALKIEAFSLLFSLDPAQQNYSLIERERARDLLL